MKESLFCGFARGVEGRQHMYDIEHTTNCWRAAYDIVGGDLQNEFLLIGVYASHFACVEMCIWKW